ncbi:TonB-dependent receptor plug domain-containing protein [Synoicihabitans lomoniglobus]|uniref:TonB-dependent receptor n=1 Tax=Synoicihabitans lomoniglobus TaxID=2909285 RepID=A0AAE9ZUS8_9BACT|nr:TonB-dependent receptor [Opitutaceae bacterium LMO-M01]WED65505.1 TonB-dependent receptor [Opitutaceae bacterium LMO-M01]
MNLKPYFFTALATLAPSAAFAQTTAPSEDDIVDLAPVIVTGETYAFGAQKLITVTSDELDRLQPVDLEDVFSQDPSVRVGGGIGVAEKIYVRGIEDKLLHVSIDGAPQGGYLSHHQSQFTVEPELLKYVEVEPGPGGALQGPGALAGAIRFVTKDANDFLAPGQTAGAFTKATYLSNGDGLKLTGALYGRAGDNVTLLAAYTWLDIGDYDAGEGTLVDYSAHEQTRAFVKGTATSDDGAHTFTLSFESIEDEGTFRHRPNFFGYFNHPVAPNIPVDMTFGRDTVTASYTQSINDEDHGLSAVAYFSDNTTDRAGQYNMGYASVGLDVRYADTYAGGTHRVTYGADYRDDTLEFTGGGSITGFARPLNYVTIPDETVNIFGAYVQDLWQATDAVEVALGARFDSYDYEDKDGNNYSDTGISPSLGVAVDLGEGFSLNASYGLAYRGPTVIDAITANEGTITNASDIDGEQATNGEFGLSYTHGVFTFAATVYRQEIDDVIVNSSLNEPGLRGNGGKLKVDGYDLSAAARWGGFNASLAVSQSDPELNGSPLTDVSFGLGSAYGRAWTAAFDYTFNDVPVRLGWNIDLVESFDEVPAGLPAKDGYDIHGVFAEWRPHDRLTLVASVHNLFDIAYTDQATAGYNSQLQRIAGLPAAGRDFRLSASFKF